MPEGFDKLAGAIGDTLKTAPTLYEDGLKPVTQESGKTLALIPRVINAALIPLRKWIAEREYNLAETEKLLAQKLEHVSENKIVTPEAYVAVPAIQAISYSMDSKELRNLYANLLAKAMNIDTKDFVHPSFVEIIKQMSPIDVQIFEEISSNGFIQTVNIYCSKFPNTSCDTKKIQLMQNPIEKHGFESLTHISAFSPDIVKVSIDNLLRLRLIEERFRIGASIDEKIKTSPFYISITEQLKKFIVDETWKYEETPQFFYLTTLGTTFRNICLDIS